MQTLMVVEDDERIREELCVLLSRNGYGTVVPDGFDDLAGQVARLAPDLVLLDLNLPGVDGTFVCREVRRTSQVPIVVVTSRDDDIDELMCLSLGADDFVPKPYDGRLLLAHVASVLRRSGARPDEPRLTCGGVTLDAARCSASHDGRSVELTKNELRILALLMRNAGTVVSRARIQEELWSTDEYVDDNTLTVNVSHLRQTLGSIGAGDLVRTRRGLGYQVG